MSYNSIGQWVNAQYAKKDIFRFGNIILYLNNPKKDVYFTASRGWGTYNAMMIFFADAVCTKDDFYDKYWQRTQDREALTFKEIWHTERAQEGNIEMEAEIGSSNNPTLQVGVQAINPSLLDECKRPGMSPSILYYL